MNYHHHHQSMASSLLSLFSLIYLLFNLTLTTQLSPPELLFEDGYAVSTVIEGDKLNLNPNSVSSQHGSSNLILLDSSASTFYTLSYPISQESTIKKLTGNAVAGYKDGELSSANFNKPKSFAVDYRGNIYVADKGNHAIRKITPSGVTTIAGGNIQKAGHADGPAKDATFSDDFELAFVPEQCALLISDHGNRLVRQINLKPEDCKQPSNNVLGSTSAWVLGLSISCVLGVVIGFVMRPYVITQGGERPYLYKETWKRSLISLGRQLWMLYYAIKSALVSSTIYSPLRSLIMLLFSHLALIFRLKVVVPETFSEKPVSLLDIDHLKISESVMIADQLKDLVSSIESHPLADNAITLTEPGHNVFQESSGKIDNMIKANLINFQEEATQPSLTQANITDFSQQSTQVSVAYRTDDKVGLIKRR